MPDRCLLHRGAERRAVYLDDGLDVLVAMSVASFCSLATISFVARAAATVNALNVVVLRHVRARVDMVPAVMLAGLFSVAFALPMALPLQASTRDLLVLAGMGTLQLGLGCLLVTVATRHLGASEIGMFALLETILGTLWVWLGIGERPTELALAGGAVVVGAVVANHWAESRAASRAAATASPA